jgi:hypothetical protein
MSDRASEALVEGFLPGERRTYDAISKRKKVPLSTLHHRARGRRPREEKALEKFLILISDLGKPMRIKFIPSLALSIARQRSTTEKPIKPPGKNWARGFEKRHPALKSRRVRAIDWKRHENNTYNKITY